MHRSSFDNSITVLRAALAGTGCTTQLHQEQVAGRRSRHGVGTWQVPAKISRSVIEEWGKRILDKLEVACDSAKLEFVKKLLTNKLHFPLKCMYDGKALFPHYAKPVFMPKVVMHLKVVFPIST
jgi:hypothetical protein